ncbi:MAG: hypothetical protein ACREHE_13340 [Rhizomicrobium sp.]
MLFRALFWIALVSILMPREPNLGFGRPGASLATAFFPQAAQAASGRPCQLGPAACMAGLSVLDRLPELGLRPLSAVKADIDEAVAERKARGE